MKMFGMLIASAMIATSFSAKAAEITCFGKDDVGQVFIVQLTDFENNKSVGTLYVEAGSGPAVAVTGFAMHAAEGKEIKRGSSDWNGSLYIEGDYDLKTSSYIFMNLEKSGRAAYKGEFCGPHNNINIGGAQFVKNDCLNVECKSNGLSKIKAN